MIPGSERGVNVPGVEVAFDFTVFNAMELVQLYPLRVDLGSCVAVTPSRMVVSYPQCGTLG